MRAGSKPPLWTCPKRGNTFVSRNLYHACGRYRLADHFDGKPPIVRRTFDAVREAYSVGSKST
ncbi:MAG: hypothetical protein ACRDHK_12270 [Actinomycetota bacterium]